MALATGGSFVQLCDYTCGWNIQVNKLHLKLSYLEYNFLFTSFLLNIQHVPTQCTYGIVKLQIP
jgi:hypothetical protein